MARSKRSIFFNLFFLVIVVLLIIPKTRVTLQVMLHKGLSFVNQSSVIDEENRTNIKYSNWKLISENGETINFGETKGEVVFINIWATWCPPCIAEMPSLQALYNDYKSNVNFLFITSDKFETVNKFKIKNDYSFETHRILSGSQSEFKTSSIPRTFIINKSGDIVVDEFGALDWNSKKVRSQLDELLFE